MNAENLNEREGLERLEVLFREESFKEASAFASDLVSAFPSSFQIGFLYYKILVKLDRYAESESVLDGLLKLYPENINLLLEKGELLVGRGKVAESKLFFDKVLFLDPFNIKAKDGVEKVKRSESKTTIGFEKYEREKIALEDTMKEADLERFMNITEEKNSTSPPEEIVQEKGEADDPIDITLSESESDFNSPIGEMVNSDNAEILHTEEPIGGEREAEKEEEITESESDTADKIETALNELNRFSESDLSTFDVKSEKSAKQDENEPESSDEGFITESAALLYLKQGLYDEAENIYAKLYKDSDPTLYAGKLEKLKRIKMGKLKINALEEFLKKIMSGRKIIV